MHAFLITPSASALLQDRPADIPTLFPLLPLRDLGGFQAALVLFLLLLLGLVFLVELGFLVVVVEFGQGTGTQQMARAVGGGARAVFLPISFSLLARPLLFMVVSISTTGTRSARASACARSAG